MASWHVVVLDWDEDPNDEDDWSTAEGDTAEDALESWAKGLDSDGVEAVLKGSLAVLMRPADGSGDWKRLRLRADAVVEFMAEEEEVDGG